MKQKTPWLLIIALLWLIQCSQIQNNSVGTTNQSGAISKALNQFTFASIEKMAPDSGYVEKYEIMMEQPLDHGNPAVGTFQQRIFLSHRSFDAPTVLITEGYSAGHNFCKELANMLSANEIRVEHRFFGKSKPDSMNWQYLNIKQAATDHHKIVSRFKQIYKDKWISTGWSKGGQTAIFHRYFYPNDIDASVIYDSPLNFDLEDKRIDDFFDQVGSEKCREKLIDFQRLALTRKNDILPLFKWYAKGKDYKYSVGIEKAYEYIVLEYPFSFWQYTEAVCDSIPDSKASDDDILNHLNAVVAFSSYADRSMNSASMFQFSTELGYYGYVTKNVESLLSDIDYPNYAYAPQVPELDYDPVPMQQVNEWLQADGDNFIYIYGENDPWSAPAIEISPQVNARKYYLSHGNHYTFINSFSKDIQSEMLNLLNQWIK